MTDITIFKNDYSYKEEHLPLYKLFAHEDSIEYYKKWNLCPPPFGLTCSWPPKKPREIERSNFLIKQYLAGKLVLPPEDQEFQEIDEGVDVIQEAEERIYIGTPNARED